MGSKLDLIVVGIFMGLLVLIGTAFGRLVKDGSDYFRAGSKGAWWMVGSNMFMSGISAYTFVGNAAGIFKTGWTPMAIYLANVCGFFLAACFLAAWYRQTRAVTFAEVIRERFGKPAEQMVAHLLVINGFMWSGVGLYTLAVFITPLMPGASVQALIIGVGLVTVMYCTIGGSWAVMANDFVQGLVLIVVTVIVTVLCLVEAGGVGAFFTAINESPAAADFRFLSAPPAGRSIWTAEYGLGWIVITFVLQLINQSSLFQGMRYFSAKDGREAQKASVLAGLMMVLGLAVFFVPPIFARLHLEPEVMAMHASPGKAIEYCYSVASFHVLPKGTFSIMILAIFAAAISTLDAALNRNSALIIRDLLPAHRKLLGMKPFNPAREVALGRLTTVAAGLVVVGVALGYSTIQNASIFDVMLTIIAQLISPQVIPLVLFLMVRKVPRWAIFTSLAGGYLPSITLWMISMNTGAVFTYQEKGFWVLVGSIGGYLLARPFWPRVSAAEKQATEAFYTRMKTPVDFRMEVGTSNDSIQLVMVGRFALLMAGLALLLLLPVDTAAGRWVIVAVAGFIGGIGLLMLVVGKRQARRALLSADHPTNL